MRPSPNPGIPRAQVMAARAAFALAIAFLAVVVPPVQILARRLSWAVHEEIQKFFCREINRIIGLEVVAQGRPPGAPLALQSFPDRKALAKAAEEETRLLTPSAFSKPRWVL
jgi:hypothetical protein